MQALDRTAADPRAHPWRLNTSNAAKLRDYQLLMAQQGMELAGQSSFDLPEVDSDPLTTAVHKASQFKDDWVLVDDGSFDVEGCDVGVNIRWLVAKLPQFCGRRALMRVLVAFRERGAIFVGEGRVAGEVVAPAGGPPPGLPILPYFRPQGRDHTLAERRDDAVNPRALAVRQLAEGVGLVAYRPIEAWQGRWQACAAAAAPRADAEG